MARHAHTSSLLSGIRFLGHTNAFPCIDSVHFFFPRIGFLFVRYCFFSEFQPCLVGSGGEGSALRSPSTT